MTPVEVRPSTAADVMTPAPRSCSKFSTVLEAVLIFRDADCGFVPVVEDGKALGVLTDRDVALAVAEFPDLGSRSVADVMNTSVVSVRPEATMEEVRAALADNQVRRLLVSDAAGRVLGVIALADIAPAMPDRAVGEVVSEVVAPTATPV